MWNWIQVREWKDWKVLHSYELSKFDLIPYKESSSGTCVDMDECRAECFEETQRLSDICHKCHENSFCTNNVGSYHCQCNDGYEGDGYNCEDKNDCEDSR